MQQDSKGLCLQGVQVVAEVDTPKKADLAAYKPRLQRLLALEGLQDPGNLVSHCMLQIALIYGALYSYRQTFSPVKLLSVYREPY